MRSFFTLDNLADAAADIVLAFEVIFVLVASNVSCADQNQGKWMSVLVHDQISKTCWLIVPESNVIETAWPYLVKNQVLGV